MKRKVLCVAIVTIILSVVVMVGCIAEPPINKEDGNRIKIGETLHQVKQRNLNQQSSWFTTQVYEVEESVYQLVIFGVNAKVAKSVDIIPGEGAWNAEGLTPISLQEPEHYYGMTVDELEKELGKIHESAGGGVFMPAYITDDGYFTYFVLKNDMVEGVCYRDMLTNKNVKSFFKNG